MVLLRLRLVVFAIALMIWNVALSEKVDENLVNADSAYICNIQSEFTNVRAGPSAKNYEVVEQLDNDEEVILGDFQVNDDGYIYFEVNQLDQNRPSEIGWVHQDLLSPGPCDSNGSKLAPNYEPDDRGPYQLEEGKCHIVLASRKHPADVSFFLAFKSFPSLSETGRPRNLMTVYRSESGWYAITSGITTKEEFENSYRDHLINNYKNFPEDVYCSDGASYRTQLSRKEIDELKMDELESYDGDRLYLSEQEYFNDLTRIPHPEKLGELLISKTSVYDFEPLENMVNLWSLDIGETTIDDLTPIAGLTKLRSLRFSETPVTTLKPLKNLEDMRVLVGDWSLNTSSLYSLDGLQNMSRLRELQLTQNSYRSRSQIIDLTPIRDLESLEVLDLRGFGIIEDFAPLKDLENLRILRVSTVEKDLSALENLEQLEKLYLEYEDLRDLDRAYLSEMKRSNDWEITVQPFR